MEIIENKYLFVTLTRNNFASLDFFIDTWGKNYNYPNMQLYNDVLFKDLPQLAGQIFYTSAVCGSFKLFDGIAAP